MSANPKGRAGQKRRETEASIVAAFDRLMRRNGPRAIGVNAVVKEARIGKGLIYKYFGGLPGLVKAWAEQNQLWPSGAELMGISDERFSGLDPKAQAKALVLNHMNALRRNPVSTDLMADELLAPSEISDALGEARKQVGREHQAIFSADHAFRDDDRQSLMIVAMAAANYLAMRAARTPRFMGKTIATEEGWKDLQRRIARVIDLAMAGCDASQAPRKAEKAPQPPAGAAAAKN